MLKKVNQLCAGFLWKGKESTARGVRVKWQEICYPRSEGGLGLKDIYSWNQACIMQNIWALITKAGSIWIAWIQAYVLKGKDFWEVQAFQNSCWRWKKLLKMRENARQFVERSDGEVRWKSSSNKYKAAEIWRVIRPRKEKVNWHKLV